MENLFIMEQVTEPQWEGKATAKLRGPKAEQVWPLLEDFCSISKWFPSIDTSYQIEGTYGQPGLVRYCSTTTKSPCPDGYEEIVKWCHEKLVAIDSVHMCLSYEVLDNNIGFKSYVATIKLLPMVEGQQDGCLMEWLFVADPVEGLTCKELLSYVEFSLAGMAKNMEEELMRCE